jgi:hypothetical protein
MVASCPATRDASSFQRAWKAADLPGVGRAHRKQNVTARVALEPDGVIFVTAIAS